MMMKIANCQQPACLHVYCRLPHSANMPQTSKVAERLGRLTCFGVAGMNVASTILPSSAFTPGDPVALLENEHYDHGGKDHFPLINKLVGLLIRSKDKIRSPLMPINVNLLNNICEAIILALAEQESLYGASNRRTLAFEEYKTLNICMKELIALYQRLI